MNKKLLKICYRVVPCIFLLIITAFTFISLFDEDKEVSEREQRELAKYPKFTFASYFEGQFLSDVETAYNDTFPFRDNFLDGYNYVKDLITVGKEEAYDVTDVDDTEGLSPEELQALLNTPFDSAGYDQFSLKADVSGVIVEGDCGYNVFNGLYDGAKRYTTFVKNLKLKYPESNVVSLCLPNASAYYPQEKYREGKHDQKAWLEMVNKNLQGVVAIDMYSELEKHTDEYIFFRTDHHWTMRGSYYGYKAVCEALKMDAVDIDSLEEGSITGFLGSLYSKTSSAALKKNPDTVYFYKPTVETTVQAYRNRKSLDSLSTIKLIYQSVSGSNKYTCFIAGDNPLTIIETNVETDKELLIIKDSTGDALTPWFVNNYKKIYVIDPRHVNTTSENVLKLDDFLSDKEGIDIVICAFGYVVNNPQATFTAGAYKLIG